MKNIALIAAVTLAACSDYNIQIKSNNGYFSDNDFTEIANKKKKKKKNYAKGKQR